MSGGRRSRPGRAVDTIVAPCTAAGSGARAIVRLSGPAACELPVAVLSLPAAPAPGRVGTARFDLGDGVGVDVEVITWRAPRSYTGEDVVEIHAPGWPALVTELVRRFVEAGARPAARGEFTRRAVMTGRLSVAEGRAVGRLATARDTEEAAAAATALTGGLARRHEALREALLSALALIEAHVDFEEEDTEAVSVEAVGAALVRAGDAAGRLAALSAQAPPVDGETDVVLLGPPNAGKSLLMLALCPGARTTVSPQAGTTRDALEAHVVRNGRRYRLLDGPGVDLERDDLDALDRAAMELYVEQLPVGAVVLHVEDVTATDDERRRATRRAVAGDRPVVAVLNKSDRLAGRDPDVPPGAVLTSALRREGLDALWAAIADAAPAPRAPDLASRAEIEAARRVSSLVQEALLGDLAGALPVVSLTLREALLALEEAEPTAADLTEEVLDRIFASFCIGK